MNSKFKKRSKASKANWQKIEPEERSRRMSELAKHRQTMMSTEEKKRQAQKLVAGKKARAKM